MTNFELFFKMEPADLKFNPIDGYLEMLKSLSHKNKLELISKLSDSLNSYKKPKNKSTRDLYGAFASKKSADEIIKDIKDSRSFNRNTEEL